MRTTSTLRASVVVVAVLLGTGSALVPPAAGAGHLAAKPATAPVARTITVCVDKRTREARVPLRGRCRAGEKRLTWPRRPPGGAPGPTGAAGAGGPAAVRYARAADGTVLGQFLSTAVPGVPVYAVLVGGGVYTYWGSGQLLAGSNTTAQFTDPACTSAPVRRTAPDAFSSTVNPAVAVGGLMRYLRGGSAGPVTAAYRATGASTPVNPGGQNLYRDDGSGCAPEGGNPYTTGTLWALEQVPTPPQGPGPVTIGP